MDVTMLANDVTALMTPLLPYLLQLGQRSAEEAGRRVGADAWETAKELWERLGDRLLRRPAALEAVREAADTPDDPDVRAALEVQLRRLLTADSTLAEEVHRLLADLRATSEAPRIVAAPGERAIAIGGDVTRSSLRTGDEVPDPD